MDERTNSSSDAPTKRVKKDLDLLCSALFMGPDKRRG